MGGGDVLDALRGMNTIVYTLSGGKYAIGIDPDTIPEGMNFIIHKKENDEKLDSIDYSQMIGPLVATLQHMDARIRALEAGNQAGNQTGNQTTKPVEKPVGNQAGDQAGNPQTGHPIDNQVENQVEN